MKAQTSRSPAVPRALLPWEARSCFCSPRGAALSFANAQNTKTWAKGVFHQFAGLQPLLFVRKRNLAPNPAKPPPKEKPGVAQLLPARFSSLGFRLSRWLLAPAIPKPVGGINKARRI